MKKKLTAIVYREEDMYVSHCPEVEIASQGYTYIEALENLKEALSLYFEEVGKQELDEIFKKDLEVSELNIELPHAI